MIKKVTKKVTKNVTKKVTKKHQKKSQKSIKKSINKSDKTSGRFKDQRGVFKKKCNFLQPVKMPENVVFFRQRASFCVGAAKFLKKSFLPDFGVFKKNASENCMQ